MLAELEAARVPPDARFLVAAALWLAAGTAMPWLLVRALWRRARHGNRCRWQ